MFPVIDMGLGCLQEVFFQRTALVIPLAPLAVTSRFGGTVPDPDPVVGSEAMDQEAAVANHRIERLLDVPGLQRIELVRELFDILVARLPLRVFLAAVNDQGVTTGLEPGLEITGGD
jgi:hypothetical protein